MEANTENKIVYPIKKHYYPRWIVIFWSVILIITVYSISDFFINEFPGHYRAYNDINIAKQYFDKKEYLEALRLYDSVLKLFPGYKNCRIMAAKTAFALSSYNNEVTLYYLGMGYLKKETYNSSEKEEIAKFVPLEYIENFKSSFSSIRS